MQSSQLGFLFTLISVGLLSFQYYAINDLLVAHLSSICFSHYHSSGTRLSYFIMFFFYFFKPSLTFIRTVGIYDTDDLFVCRLRNLGNAYFRMLMVVDCGKCYITIILLFTTTCITTTAKIIDFINIIFIFFFLSSPQEV